MSEFILCPKCKKPWPKKSEQAMAVKKRSKCIVCIVDDKEEIDMNPYEFQVDTGL